MPLLTPEELQQKQPLCPDWQLCDKALSISRTFEFGDYASSIVFVTQVAQIAEKADHHPDIQIGYRNCNIRYSTHSAGGLTEKDFACAQLIDDAFEAMD